MSADLTPKPADDLVDLDELPMADDRTAGYAILRAAGPVAQVGTGASSPPAMPSSTR
jgi:hypothetical protein